MSSALSKPGCERLQKLLPHFANGEASLADCLKTLFAGKPLADQLNQFTKLRKTVNDAALEHGSQLTFCVDTEKKQPPEARRCWFEAESAMEAEAEKFSRDGTADIAALPQVHNRAISVTGALLEGKPDPRRNVKIFICYAREYLTEARELVERLKLKFAAFGRCYVFELWRDDLIEIGTDWDRSIRAALADCDAALMLLSDAFFASNYIQTIEQPWLIAQKMVLPVALGSLPTDKTKLGELSALQIYFHQTPKGKKGKSYLEHRKGRLQQDEFVGGLFEKIEQRLDSHFKSAAASVADRPDSDGSANEEGSGVSDTL